MDDVIINKIAVIERCISRIKEEYMGFEQDFLDNYTKQDSVIINIERAIQAALDIAMHIIRINKFGLPQNSRDIFALLVKKKVISQPTGNQMQKMVGFRNIAVHDYQKLNMDIVISIIDTRLTYFTDFSTQILRYEKA